MQPTEEQQIAIGKFQTKRPLKIAAFAGAGKTSTLAMLAGTRRARGLYLAFNKAVANEAAEKFPKTVDCRTTHSIAFRSVVPKFQSTPKLTTTLHPKQLAELAELQPRSFGAKLQLQGVQQAHLILGTIKRFCQSASPSIEEAHVPRYGRLMGANAATIATVRRWAVAEASKLWQRMIAKHDQVPMGHDGYLKLWALGRPKLAAEYILLDEAQDTNQVVLAVLQAQSSQMVYVGDKHQQIYEWRGAVNAMEQVTGCDETYLTQSFRFGETIAAAASQVIATLGERQRLRGNASVRSTLGDPDATTRAVLSRTNATVIVEVLDASRAGRRPYIVGGTTELSRLLRDVYELKQGKPAASPEFFGFADWGEAVDFGESEEGESVAAFVDLVQAHGEGKLWGAVKSVASEERNADIILSTAHKAKGREWDSVRLSPDFVNTAQGTKREGEEETRLFYVAITRARELLCVDPEILAHFTAEPSNPAKTPQAPIYAPPPARRLSPSERVGGASPRSHVAPKRRPPDKGGLRDRVRRTSTPQAKQPKQ
jgi:hypothetical protein